MFKIKKTTGFRDYERVPIWIQKISFNPKNKRERKAIKNRMSSSSIEKYMNEVEGLNTSYGILFFSDTKREVITSKLWFKLGLKIKIKVKVGNLEKHEVFNFKKFHDFLETGIVNSSQHEVNQKLERKKENLEHIVNLSGHVDIG